MKLFLKPIAFTLLAVMPLAVSAQTVVRITPSAPPP